MNNIQVIGNLTGDPIQTEIGEYKVTKFTVAADRRQSKGEKKTDFFKVITPIKHAGHVADI